MREQFGNFLVHGLVTGSMYAAVALGLTLTYGILGILNFAHGEMLMVGAYIAFVLTSRLGVNFLVAAVISMLAVGHSVALLLLFFYFSPVQQLCEYVVKPLMR